ncbi:MFS domain-containing protein [Fusarium sp. LHS14.1]|nr:MFS domain-containing protein [Fusarium sp. LHS14.1]
MASSKRSFDIEMVENQPNLSFQALSEEELIVEKALVRKMDYRLLPVTAIIYLLCYLDRSNIGNARILNSDTGDDIMQALSLTSHQYTIALMLFLVAYFVFEAPSNLALKVLSPKRWLGFLVFAFGAFCMGIGGARNFATVSALRFFLGAAEAGVFPGMIYYLSFWYKPEERAFRIAAFLCSATLAGAFGGCIAYGVGFMNRAGGLQAWRWLFILEGAPSVIMGVCVFFLLPSYPEQCAWLSKEEKAVQSKRLGEFAKVNSKQKITWADAKTTLLDLRLYAHYLAYLGIGCLIGSLSLFAPTIVLGLGFEGLRAQLFTVPPYAAAFLSTIAASIISDRFNSRGLVVTSSLGVCFVSFLILAALPGEQFVARYVILIIGTCGAFSGLPSVNAWVGDNMTNTTAMSLATAFNIAFSGPGQIVGVWIYRPGDKPLYTLGHGVNAGFAAMSAFLCAGLTVYYRRLNSNGKLRPDGRPWIS